MVVCTRAKHENGKKKGTGEQKPPPVPGDSASERDSAACKQKGQWSAQAEEETWCASGKGGEARRQERQRVCKQKPAMPPWDRRDIAGSEQDYAYAKTEMQSAIRICPM